MNIALFGSGEFTPAVTPIDEYLITTFKPSSIAVIPTAAGKERDAIKWLHAAERHYRAFDIRFIPVPIFNRADADNAELVKPLSDADWIFFSGGSPSYLLSTLRGSLLWSMVSKRAAEGALLAGSSAGAMVMGSYVLTNPFHDFKFDLKNGWEPAFGLVPQAIIPHFDRWNSRLGAADKLMGHSPDVIKNAWMGIDEDTALITSGDDKVVMGVGGVTIHDGLKSHVMHH